MKKYLSPLFCLLVLLLGAAAPAKAAKAAEDQDGISEPIPAIREAETDEYLQQDQAVQQQMEAQVQFAAEAQVAAEALQGTPQADPRAAPQPDPRAAPVAEDDGLAQLPTGQVSATGSQAPAAPQASPTGTSGKDPPARVGRLATFNGQVSLQPAGTNAWAAATRNRPVTHGDALWSDKDSRAEVQVGTLTVRLGASTAARLTGLDDATVQVSLTQGQLSVRVRELPAGSLIEVDMPNAAVTLQKVGLYRLDYDAAAHRSQVTVRHGKAEVLSAGSAFEVPQGKSALITGEEHPEHQLILELPSDSLDAFAAQRDRAQEHPAALKYVSRATVGYEDLDDNGTWNTATPYGALWVPRGVAAGWAPYHYGSWSYVDPWGWTWVDDSPWGFAPFHYGRWVNYQSSWGWVPGAYAVHPCYAPALVGFVGAGIGVGMVGWFALGPHEVYVPGYQSSYGYVRNVNVGNVAVSHATNLTNIQNNNVYVNRNVPGAVAQVPQSVMQNSQPVAANRQLGAMQNISQARVLSAPNVMPQRASILGPAGKGATVLQPPVQAQRQAVLMRHMPAMPQPSAPLQQVFRPNTVRGTPMPVHQGIPGAPSAAPRPMPAAPYTAPQILRIRQPARVENPVPTQQYRAPSQPHYTAPAPTYRAPSPIYRAPPPAYRAPPPGNFNYNARPTPPPSGGNFAPPPSFNGGGGGIGGANHYGGAGHRR